MTRTITALFDTFDEADRATRALAEQVGGIRGSIYDSRMADAVRTISVPAEDRATLEENIRRGGAVFYAEVPDDKFEAVSRVLEETGAVDFEEKEAAWRREGWTGWSGTATTGTTTAATTGTARRDIEAAGTEERIPLAEERLVVGKRDVGRGRIRIRSYVVERPVEERVALREERVDVERRPVDRTLQPGDEAFHERVIEATETAEEAVVSKEARVREEVVVRKNAEEHTETVRDTVRRTEVDVENGAERMPAGTLKGHTTPGVGAGQTAHASMGGSTGPEGPDGTPGNPSGTAASRTADRALGTNMSGAHPEHDNPDGTPGNPPGTMASRAVDKTLGTNISGSNPGSRKE
jgi:uncharacterized protein (TIGR02271 family)